MGSSLSFIARLISAEGRVFIEVELAFIISGKGSDLIKWKFLKIESASL